MVNRGLHKSLQIHCLIVLAALLVNGADAQAPPGSPVPELGPHMTLLWLSVKEKSTPSGSAMNVKFNRKAVDDFQRCMCRSDFAHCQVLANGTVLEKNQWPATKQNVSFMCKASNDSAVTCDGLQPPAEGFRPPALNVFGNQCPLRNVNLYWDDKQAVNVSVREGYADAMLRCADKCKTMEEMERGDGGRANATVIALAVVCVFLFVVAVALLVYCLIRRRCLRQARVADQEKKAVVDDGISEKKNAPIESVCSYTEKEKPKDMASFGSSAPYGHKVMANEERLNRSYDSPPGFPLLVWPTEASVRPPDYELDPPPYFSVFRPEIARGQGMRENTRSPNSSPREETASGKLSIHLQNPRSRASIHTDV